MQHFAEANRVPALSACERSVPTILNRHEVGQSDEVLRSAATPVTGATPGVRDRQDPHGVVQDEIHHAEREPSQRRTPYIIEDAVYRIRGARAGHRRTCSIVRHISAMKSRAESGTRIVVPVTPRRSLRDRSEPARSPVELLASLVPGHAVGVASCDPTDPPRDLVGPLRSNDRRVISRLIEASQ